MGENRSASLCDVDPQNSCGARPSRPSGRTTSRILVTAALASGLVAALALPASAATGGVGDAYSPSSLGLPLTLALFIGIPLLGFVIAGLIALRPQRGSKAGYRPGRPWDHDTEWFGTPPDRQADERRMALPHAGGARGSW